MHPEIRRFPSSEFYSNKLRDAQRITVEVEQFNSGTLGDDKKRRVVADFIRVNSRLHLNPVMFFNLNSREETHGKSFRNSMESNFVFSFLSFLSPVLLGFSVGIITPYKSQVDAIRKEIYNLRQGNSSSSNTSSSSSSITSAPSSNFWRELSIDVNTVDGYQGKEKDIIILSTVRTRSIGFLTDQRRLNVAITRAKRCLVIIGSQRLLCEDPIWNHMITDLQERQCVFNVNSDDFKNYSGYHDLQVGVHGKTATSGTGASAGTAVRGTRESNLNSSLAAGEGAKSTGAAPAQTVGTAVVNPRAGIPPHDHRRPAGATRGPPLQRAISEEGEVAEVEDPVAVRLEGPPQPQSSHSHRQVHVTRDQQNSGILKRGEKRRGEHSEDSTEKRFKSREV
jgi:hypothetical protein